MQPVGIGRVQNDLQACIQSFLKAFSLFLVFSVPTKPNKTLHFNVSPGSRSEQKFKKKHFNAEIRLPFSNWFHHRSFFLPFFEAIQHILTSRAFSKACRRAKYGNCWIQSQAGIKTNVESQMIGRKVKLTSNEQNTDRFLENLKIV